MCRMFPGQVKSIQIRGMATCIPPGSFVVFGTISGIGIIILVFCREFASSMVCERISYKATESKLVQQINDRG